MYMDKFFYICPDASGNQSGNQREANNIYERWVWGEPIVRVAGGALLATQPLQKGVSIRRSPSVFSGKNLRLSCIVSASRYSVVFAPTLMARPLSGSPS